MPIRKLTPKLRLYAAVAAVFALMATAFVIWQTHIYRSERMKPGKFPKQLVYVRTQDDVVDTDAIFTPPPDSAKPLAIDLNPRMGH